MMIMIVTINDDNNVASADNHIDDGGDDGGNIIIYLFIYLFINQLHDDNTGESILL